MIFLAALSTIEADTRGNESWRIFDAELLTKVGPGSLTSRQLAAALDGDIHTSHVGFLHLGRMQPDDLPLSHPSRIRLRDLAPEFETVQTAGDNMSGAYRDFGPNERYWSLAHFLFPFWTLTANHMRFSMPWLARGWVPLDDIHTMLIKLLDKNFALPPGRLSSWTPETRPCGRSRSTTYVPIR